VISTVLKTAKEIKPRNRGSNRSRYIKYRSGSWLGLSWLEISRFHHLRLRPIPTLGCSDNTDGSIGIYNSLRLCPSPTRSDATTRVTAAHLSFIGFRLFFSSQRQVHGLTLGSDSGLAQLSRILVSHLTHVSFIVAWFFYKSSQPS
jgi:hypothetical protein